MRKNVQLAKFQSESYLHLSPSVVLAVSLRFSFSVLNFFFLCGSDLRGLSIAAYVIAVLLALTIIVDGWFEILHSSSFGLPPYKFCILYGAYCNLLSGLIAE